MSSIQQNEKQHSDSLQTAAKRPAPAGKGETQWLYIKDGGSPDSLSAKTILGEMFDALRDGIRTARL
jgi:hypothetical protein